MFTLRGPMLGCALFLKRRGALNYRACRPSMIPVENEVFRLQTPQKNFLQVVQRTKLRCVIFPRTYPLTHQASELSFNL